MIIQLYDYIVMCMFLRVSVCEYATQVKEEALF